MTQNKVCASNVANCNLFKDGRKQNSKINDIDSLLYS